MPSPLSSVLGRRSIATSEALTTSPGRSERVSVAASTVSVTVPVKRNAARRDKVLPGSSKGHRYDLLPNSPASSMTARPFRFAMSRISRIAALG